MNPGFIKEQKKMIKYDQTEGICYINYLKSLNKQGSRVIFPFPVLFSIPPVLFPKQVRWPQGSLHQTLLIH